MLLHPQEQQGPPDRQGPPDHRAGRALVCDAAAFVNSLRPLHTHTQYTRAHQTHVFANPFRQHDAAAKDLGPTSMIAQMQTRVPTRHPMCSTSRPRATRTWSSSAARGSTSLVGQLGWGIDHLKMIDPLHACHYGPYRLGQDGGDGKYADMYMTHICKSFAR
jgi:hypothetical protein